MSDRHDLIVIGGGPAGVTAALRAAELGASVTLLERGRLGGTCTEDGCAPTRVLAKAARLMRDATQLSEYGMRAPAPELDLRALLAVTQRTVYRLQEKKQLLAHLERAGVIIHEQAGAVRFVDPRTVRTADGRDLAARSFILACGGHPRRLDLPGSELALTHSDVWNMTSLPRRLAVVGASATGVQLASVFAAFGSAVTLLEQAQRILPGEDPDISAALSAGFASHGIAVHAGVRAIERIERHSGAIRLTYRDDVRGNGSAAGEAVREAPGEADRGTDAERSLDVDAVILAIGWPSNVADLEPERAGIQTRGPYVAVDDALRTTAPHIFAAGDITGRMMLVQSATYEGRVAAENAVRGEETPLSHVVVAHGGFTDPEYAAVGMSEAEAAGVGREVVTGVVPYADLDRAVIDGRTEGFCKLVVDRAAQRVLGAQVVGEQAVEVVQIAAAAIAARMPVERLAETEFAYPTFTAIVGLAARQAVHALRMPGEEARAWEALGRPRVAEWERREA